MSALSTADRRTLQRVLNGALAAEARSAFAYGLQISEGLEAALAPEVRQAIVDLRSQLGAAASSLANLILEHGGTPDPGNFPLVATNYNFLNVRPLLERLAPSIPADAARLEALASALTEPAAIRELIRTLAKQKRAQHTTVLGLLEKLTPAATSVPPGAAAGATPPIPAAKPKLSPEEIAALQAKKKAEVEAKKAAAPPTPPTA